MQRHPQQTACADDLVLGGIFIEILQAGKGSWNLPDFIENDESVRGKVFLPEYSSRPRIRRCGFKSEEKSSDILELESKLI